MRTLEAAVALAGRFGIHGEIYQSAGELPGTTDYVITDGKQWMSIRSDHYFTYYADYPNSQALPGDWNKHHQKQPRISRPS